MSKCSETHYLACIDENCEAFACVARRDYESQNTCLRTENANLKIDKAMSEWRYKGPLAEQLAACESEVEKLRQAIRDASEVMIKHPYPCNEAKAWLEKWKDL